MTSRSQETERQVTGDRLQGTGKAGARCWGLAAEEIVEEGSKIHFKVSGDFAEDGVQRADAEFLVGGDRDVMLGALLLRGQADVASGLTGSLIAEAPEQRRQPGSVEVARELQAGMTSSFTR